MESPAETTASAVPPGLTEAAPVVRSLGPILATGAGLALALAGTFAVPVVSSTEAVTRRVTVALPDWLAAVAFASVVLAAAIGIVLVLPRPRPRRKKGEDEYEMYQEPRRLPPLLGIALIVLALSPAAALTGVLFWFGHETIAPSERGSIIAPHLPFSGPAATSTAPRPTVREPASPVTTGLVGAFAALAAFGVLAFVGWLGFGDRWTRREGPDERYRIRVAQAVDESLEDLRSEPDARVAIQKIYRNFEHVLAAADVRKREWQTPSEFMGAAIARLPLPYEPVEELTRLFEIARFSAHPLGIDGRERAWQSLTAIRASIAAEQGRPEADVS